MAFEIKKVRKMFPKKGPERKALKFASNIERMPKIERGKIIKRFLKSKSVSERKVALSVLRTYKERAPLFGTFNELVKDFRKVNPSFSGVIIFGGIVKKKTAPTDLDFIFVGNLADSEKKRFCDLLSNKTGVPANPFPVKLDVVANPNVFESLLKVPYLHNPQEWTVQNFVGPNNIRRLLMNSYKRALKRINPAVIRD